MKTNIKVQLLFLLKIFVVLAYYTSATSDINLNNNEQQETRITPNQIQMFIMLNQIKSSIESLVKIGNKTLDIASLIEQRSKFPFDCCDISRKGFRKTDIYQIEVNQVPIEVLCDMDTEGGGWTVIQRRTLDGIDVNFRRNWTEYGKGFGIVPQSYWIGLANIAYLTSNNDQEIRFDMESFDTEKGKAHAKYGHFNVSGPEDKYRLSIHNYSGTAGSSMFLHNGMQFSTADNDNDKSSGNCAQDRKGGWWYNTCNNAHPNGILYSKEIYAYNSVHWYGFYTFNSLKLMEIKIRNKNPKLCGI